MNRTSLLLLLACSLQAIRGQQVPPNGRQPQPAPNAPAQPAPVVPSQPLSQGQPQTVNNFVPPPGAGPQPRRKQVAVIGAGVIGVSTALAFYSENTGVDVTVFYDRPFLNTTSWGPAGLYRLEKGGSKYRRWGLDSFQRYTQLFRDIGGDTGVQSVSGYITSKNRSLLKLQEDNFGDFVYDFRWLKPWELKQFNNRTDLHAIHYTAYTTEGRRYVPWMVEQLKLHGAQFVQRHINSVNELLPAFDVVVNAAGIDGPKVAGDVPPDDTFPIRGMIFELDAPWHKHFLYEELITFTIPTINAVWVGSQKQVGNWNAEITDEDRRDVLSRYVKLQPAMRNVKIKSEWLGFRPGRNDVRLELVKRGDKRIIHNYGHGGNGFTLSWGCALDVVRKAFQ